MEYAAFLSQANAGFRLIPVVLETLADFDTPLSIYRKLAKGRGSYLFESVIGGERFGRYSFIGVKPSEIYTVTGHSIQVERDGMILKQETVGDPLAWIDSLTEHPVGALPVDLRFAGGLVGYFAYESVRYIEPRVGQLGRPDPIGLPEIQLFRSEELAIVDNLSGKLYLVVYADLTSHTPEAAWSAAQGRLDELRRALRGPVAIPEPVAHTEPGVATSNLTEAEFHAHVQRGKELIVEGDIFQVQISQRLTRPYHGEPINLYRALRSINPSPYMYFMDLGDAQIVGASPEILVRREGDKVTVRPIAGTRKRGATPERDEALRAELVADPKEIAEHVMLIDLGRNDVGRIAKIGSVKVTETMVVERYSHVMHMVSNVEAEVPAALTPMELFRATFPAGTVTGTPKVRAMEVIESAESVRRGVYAGAVGYIGYHGNMDLAIAIRTGVIKDGQLHVQAAAGVVADSQPELEWLETNNKARALLRAAEWVERGLDGVGAATHPTGGR
jgi:anthranilate synthase component I